MNPESLVRLLDHVLLTKRLALPGSTAFRMAGVLKTNPVFGSARLAPKVLPF